MPETPVPVVNDLVSILMPMHNAETYVADAVRSCLRQTHEDWELIVVDDASTDGSAEVVESISDSRVRLIRLSKNVGPGLARNVALAAARGEWVTVLDADDLYCSGRLAGLLTHAKREGTACVLLDRLKRWELVTSPPDEFLDLCGDSVLELRRWRIEEWLEATHGGKPFFHKHVLADSRIRYPDVRGPEDTVFFVRLVQWNGLRILETPEQSYVYRRTPRSLATRSRKRLSERQRAYELLAAEFTSPEPLAEAIRVLLETNEFEVRVFELRTALARKKLLAVARALAASPRVFARLIRRVPVWFRSRWRVRRRRQAQSKMVG